MSAIPLNVLNDGVETGRWKSVYPSRFQQRHKQRGDEQALQKATAERGLAGAGGM